MLIHLDWALRYRSVYPSIPDRFDLQGSVGYKFIREHIGNHDKVYILYYRESLLCTPTHSLIFQNAQMDDIPLCFQFSTLLFLLCPQPKPCQRAVRNWSRNNRVSFLPIYKTCSLFEGFWSGICHRNEMISISPCVFNPTVLFLRRSQPKSRRVLSLDRYRNNRVSY